MKRITLVLGLALVAASCAHAPGGGKAQTLSLNEGQSAGLSSGGRITFTNVVNESRCPTGVQCIWAGTATARFRVMPESGSQPVDTLGVSVTLAELTPYPVAGRDNKSVRHRALVKVRSIETR